jgi:methylated-DNA-[protein]-cysteine S-methyltransferase
MGSFKMVYSSRIGDLLVEHDGDAISSLECLEEAVGATGAKDPLSCRVTEQLDVYFRDGGFRFSLPLHLGGTAFQRRVWERMQRIPAGSTLTYGEMAAELNSSAQAVGNACRSNPVPVIVPCHRVVGAGGIGGYSGETAGRQIDIKRWLLAHEGVLS